VFQAKIGHHHTILFLFLPMRTDLLVRSRLMKLDGELGRATGSFLSEAPVQPTHGGVFQASMLADNLTYCKSIDLRDNDSSRLAISEPVSAMNNHIFKFWSCLLEAPATFDVLSIGVTINQNQFTLLRGHLHDSHLPMPRRERR
jgi:hypothetical protein